MDDKLSVTVPCIYYRRDPYHKWELELSMSPDSDFDYVKAQAIAACAYRFNYDRQMYRFGSQVGLVNVKMARRDWQTGEPPRTLPRNCPMPLVTTQAEWNLATRKE